MLIPKSLAFMCVSMLVVLVGILHMLLVNSLKILFTFLVSHLENFVVCVGYC